LGWEGGYPPDFKSGGKSPFLEFGGKSPNPKKGGKVLQHLTTWIDCIFLNPPIPRKDILYLAP